MHLFVKAKWIKSGIVLFLIFFVFKGQFTAGEPFADLVILSANIHTMDDSRPRAEAVAVDGDRISFVGSNDDARRQIGPNTKTIDAGGKLVLPGFNDSHVHLASIGNQFFSIDLSTARSPRELVENLRFYTRFLPKGQWILGGRWNHEIWTPASLASKELIDEATPDHPVFVYHRDPQIVLLNSLALRLARIDRWTKDPPNGEILRDERGEPNGILRGEAISLVRRFTPVSPTANISAVLQTATNYAAVFGVTSVQDVHSDDIASDLRRLAGDGKLKTRVYDCVGLFDWRRLVTAGIKHSSGNSLVRQGCLKHFSEGDSQLIPGLVSEIAAADKADLQVMMHAIGSRANEIVLTIFERVAEKNGPRDRRFRVEHAHMFRQRDVVRFARSDIIASMQPFLFYDGRADYARRFRMLRKASITLAFGSDAAISELNPLSGIFAAVNPRSPNSLTVDEAVRSYTLDAAYAEFQETEKGSITIGKLADFIVLSDDIFSIDPLRIREARVLTTVLGGRVVYQVK